MNLFRTPITPSVSSHTLQRTDTVVTVGSCFADAIGRRLVDTRLPALANPFGTLFNPHAIHKVLDLAISHGKPAPGTFLQHGDIHLNYDFHSELSSLTLAGLQDRIHTATDSTHRYLQKAACLVITYGTAWVYRRKDTGEIVANCHKQPAAGFVKELLTPEATINSFETLHRTLQHFNPNLRVILTVSPVRHLKDTLELNSVSKATLRLACHHLQQAHDHVTYFPAYELMMDDLRDYRFYTADMLHPTPEAEDYIWQHFTDSYFSPELKAFATRWKAIRQALAHKPFHPTSQSHQQFLRETLKKLEDIRPLIDVEDEILSVKALLTDPA